MISANKLLVLLLALFAFSCSKCDPPSQDAVAATLHDYTGLDGCGWVIKLDNNEVLEPTNLEGLNFELKENKKVWVKYTLSENQISICMVGPKVVIGEIWDR